jgi:hypothetical protein
MAEDIEDVALKHRLPAADTRSRCLHAGLLAIGVEIGSNDTH